MKITLYTSGSLAARFCAAGLLFGGLTLRAQTPATVVSSSSPSESAPNASEIVTLSPFDVTVTGDAGYGTTNELGGTRINMPIIDSPMSIATINQQLIEDMGFRDLADALHVVSGMSSAGALSNGQYTYRGFPSSGSNYRDGIPETFAISGLETVDSILFDRVEVIKGPAGVLFGSMGIGGTVNRISKRPLPVDTTWASVGYDTFQVERGEFDTSQTWISTPNNKLTFRLPLAYQHGKTHDQGVDDRFATSPSIQYSDNHGDTLWIYAIYEDSQIDQAETVPADKTGAIFPGLNAESVMWPTDDDSRNHRIIEFGYTKDNLEIFNAPSSLRFVGRFINDYTTELTSRTNTDYSVYNPQGVLLGTNPNLVWSQVNVGTIAYGGLAGDDTQAGFKGGVVSMDFSTTFDLLGGEHKAFAYAQVTESRTIVTDITPLFPAPLGNGTAFLPFVERWPYNILPLNWGPGLWHAEENLGNDVPVIQNQDTYQQATDTAVATQDNVSYFHDKLIVVGGVRFDNLVTNNQNYVSNAFSQTQDSAFSWKYGLVVKPVPGASLYYNHATTFQPQYTVDNNPLSPTYGKKFPDVQGTLNEGGIKLDAFDNRLIGSIVYYKSNLNNQLLTVFPPGVTSGAGISEPIGTVFSNGEEFDLTGEPLRSATLGSVDILASASNNHAETATGLLERGSPAKTWAAVGKYSFPGALKGLAIVYEWQAAITRSADGSADNIKTPNFFMSDLNVIYARANWRLQLTIDNLFNSLDEITGSITVSRESVYPQRNANLKYTYTF